jgi:hypothetical protein
MVAKRKQGRTFADRVIEADHKFVRYLLSAEGEEALIPRESIVIFDDKPALVVEIDGSSVSVRPTPWDQLAAEVDWKAPHRNDSVAR